MKIKLIQTASNIKQEFDVEGEDFFAQGKAGSFSKYQALTLTFKDYTILGTYQLPRLRDALPFPYLLGKEGRRCTFRLTKDGEEFGSICRSLHGFMKRSYVITPKEGEPLQAYSIATGRENHVPIFKGDTQIALIETDFITDNLKYTHEILILDEYAELAPLLAFFGLYFANVAFTNRLHMTIGRSGSYTWSISRYRHKYDPNWREEHFPYRGLFSD